MTIFRVFVIFIPHADKDKAKERDEFSQAYLKLSKDDGPVIGDGMHTLFCYKPITPPNPSYTLKGTVTVVGEKELM